MPHSIILESDKHHTLFDKLKKNLGWNTEYLEFINSDEHARLKDMDLMIDALDEIKKSGQLVTVLPDFDLDGISSGVLTWAGLAELGFNVDLYVPDYRRGHNIEPETIDDLVAKHPDTAAIFVCDGGTNSHEGMQRGKDLGLTMLVTDHHTQESAFTPADVLINPMRIDETYTLGGICGAHVAWQVLDEYTKAEQPGKIRDIALLRAFAGIGTVADVMPLLHENRTIVRDALAILRMLYVNLPPEDTASEYHIDQALLIQMIKAGKHSEKYLNAFEGLANVLRAFREYGPLEPLIGDDGNPVLDEDGNEVVRRQSGKLRKAKDIDAEFIGWYMAPAFNSIRRVEGNMNDAFDIFTHKDPDEQFEAAKRLLDVNEKRKEAVIYYLEEIEEIDQPWAPWVWLTSAPGGMRGLIAARLMEERQMPVAVIDISDDPTAPRSGSGRAPEWYDIIANMQSDVYSARGHAQACGVFMKDEKAVSAFMAHLEMTAETLWAEIADNAEDLDRADLILGYGPGIDGGLDNVEEITDLAIMIDSLGPFGHGFPQPIFELSLNATQCRISTLGENDDHLQILTPSGIKVLGWNMAEALPDLAEKAQETHPKDQMMQIIARLQINEFQEWVTPQFIIERIL